MFFCKACSPNHSLKDSECLRLKQAFGAFPQGSCITSFTPPSQREPAISCVDYGEECWRESQRYVRSANLTGSAETSEISYPYAVTRGKSA